MLATCVRRTSALRRHGALVAVVLRRSAGVPLPLHAMDTGERKHARARAQQPACTSRAHARERPGTHTWADALRPKHAQLHIAHDIRVCFTRNRRASRHRRRRHPSLQQYIKRLWPVSAPVPCHSCHARSGPETCAYFVWGVDLHAHKSTSAYSTIYV